MNNKITEIHRDDLENLFEIKMTDKEWEIFCNQIHEKIVPTLFEEIVNGIITTIYVGCDVIAPHLTK
jgi:hypothetical protein